MYAMQLASGTPSALVDWNNNYGADEDKCVLFHCGNWAKSFLPTSRWPTRRSWVPRWASKTPGCARRPHARGTPDLRPDHTDDCAGAMRAYVGEASSRTMTATFAPRAVARVPKLQKLMRYVCNRGFRAPRRHDASQTADVLAEAFELTPAGASTTTNRRPNSMPTDHQPRSVAALPGHLLRAHQAGRWRTHRRGFVVHRHPERTSTTASSGWRPRRSTDPRRDRYARAKGHCVEALYVVSPNADFPARRTRDARPLPVALRRPPTRQVQASSRTRALGHGLPLLRRAGARGEDGRCGLPRIHPARRGELAEGSNWEAAMAAPTTGSTTSPPSSIATRSRSPAAPADVMNSEPLEGEMDGLRWAVRRVGRATILRHLTEGLRAPLARRPGRPS